MFVVIFNKDAEPLLRQAFICVRINYVADGISICKLLADC